MSLRPVSSPRPDASSVTSPVRSFDARRSAGVVAGLIALCLAGAGCTAADPSASAGLSAGDPVAARPVSEASITSSVGDRAKNVPVDETVKLAVENGTFEQVHIDIGKGRKTLKGKLSADKTTWTSTQDLEPSLKYRVSAVAVDAEGLKATSSSGFRTDKLTLDEQTYPSIAPLAGETVGVGMPVIVNFDVAVANRKVIEKRLSVETSPKQVGAWHWVNDNEVHWRPKNYWKPGTDVTVNADINSVHAGNGIYGQVSRSTSFRIGDSVVSKVDVASHTMQVYVNGTLQRTMPVSAGKPGFITRSGTKVIVEKIRHKTMDAATLGIPESSPEYYNLDVEYAMRVTYSGEFLHAAPWSAGSQGVANVSHGCVGMSETDAAWLFNITQRGDVVEVTGSDRYMTLYNGYGDWNASFKDYKQGSSLS